MIAPANMPGIERAIRVTTGIMLLRITWVITTLFFAETFGSSGSHVVLVEVVNTEGAGEICSVQRR